MTGRYPGNPMAAHLPLGLGPAHFARWLALFEATARAECTAAEGAEHPPCVMCGRPPRCKGFLDATAPRSGAVMCPASMCGAHDRGP
jgi:hypothetical protein